MSLTPSSIAVTWRQLVAAMVATALCLTALVVVFRSDGLPAVDAASSRATRWFVHAPTGRAVLVDGFGGRALASVDAGAGGQRQFIAEGGGQAYLLNDTVGEVREIDTADLRLGSARGVPALGSGTSFARAGASGLVVADSTVGEGVLLPVGADAVEIPFQSDQADGAETATMVALGADGTIWSLVDGDLERATTAGVTTQSLGLAPGPNGGAISLVGTAPLVLDRIDNGVRFGDGEWQALPTSVDGSELVLQQAGPQHDCGWVGANDDLWCVGPNGIQRSVSVPELDIDGSDLLAIAGDVATLVRRGPTQVVRFDWRSQEVLETQQVAVAADAVLAVTATVDVVWIDDTAGDFVWSVHPWGIEAIDKNGALLVLGDQGEVIDESNADGSSSSLGSDDGVSDEPDVQEADDNGIDDPPVAVDDQATARSGNPVPVRVTANDYDPDGEAIAIVDVDTPGNGLVEIGTASTIIYTPTTGYVGVDRFTYTIADGDGTEASADVVIELLPADATNQPPVGAADTAQTGPSVDVVIDVLLNDVDPERDVLNIDAFTQPQSGGVVEQVQGPSGLPSLRFAPDAGFEGIAQFSYRPIDSFGAVGADVNVEVEVARLGEANRPPVVRPDAVRTRRNSEVLLPVLVNDLDPDGDTMLLSVVTPLPDGLDVAVRGDQLGITARAGSTEFVPFEYEVDDGNGHVVRGAVLVVVIDDVEPNRPPVVSPDVATAVVGQTVVINVTANDTDPDGDPLAVIGITQPERRGTARIVGRDQVEFTASAFDDEVEGNTRFTYTVTDGNGHEVAGEVTVTVLSEPLPEPPYAQDDSTFTFVNQPVTIDVLRNDGDPSGERPSLVGTPGCAGGGRATVTTDSQVRYDPPFGQTGAFRCTYEVANSQGLRDDASIIISVREPEVVNEAPIARDDFVTVEVGVSQRVDVLANDEDPDGEDGELRVTSSTRPLIGTAVRSGNVITYTAGQTTGTATIEYQVADSDGALATGRLQVTIVEPILVPPEARPDGRTIAGPGVPTQIDLLANDIDPDGAPGGLRVVSATLDGGPGSVSLFGSVVTITPAVDFVGTLSGSYTISDEDLLTASSTFSLTVLEPLNRPPVAVDDATSVVNGGTVTSAVLFNDSDPDGDLLSLSIISGPDSTLGTARVSGDQAITFTANPGQSGTAVVQYQVSDGEFTDSAALRIAVATCAQSTPTARDAFLQTGYQQPITVDLSAYASNGVVTEVSGPPSYQGNVYTPPAGTNNNVTISYAVVNDCRQRATGTITIDVNQDPVGQNQSISLGRDETRELPVGVLASDAESLTIIGSAGAPGWASTGPARVVVAPTQSVADGVYTWTVTVADPGGLTTQVGISVTITNKAPQAQPDAIDASAGAPVSVDIVANDVDPDGPNSSLRVQSVPSSVTYSNGVTGTLELLGDGRTVRVTPGGGRGNATFDYSVVDGSGAVSPSVSVSVTGPAENRAPNAADQTANVRTGQVAEVVLAASDPDGDQITAQIVSDPSGIVSDGPDGLVVEVTAAPPGTYTFTYNVVDTSGAVSRTATVTVIATTPATTTTVADTTTTTVPDTTTTTTTTATTTTTTATTTTTTTPTTTTTTVAPPTTVE
ncbi:MAG: Ig-like domain-containing protein [Ilumatobacter sp.]|uniref:Ig-like domain-containing protein n=1 Tax=Ilumatobacter sp. TaxID=1967498 RepID=UPI00391AD6DF